MDNGVDREAPIDLFVMGENTWRKEQEWPLARTQWTNFYLRTRAARSTRRPATAGEHRRTGASPRTRSPTTPGNPTPYLVDARELELSLNEDYREVHATRADMLKYTTAPLEKDTEITGPMTRDAVGGNRREGHRLERHDPGRLPRRAGDAASRTA